MAVWTANPTVLYFPPSPITKIPSTDDYVERTGIYYHAESERLLTVGHPWHEVKRSDGTVVPKVSPNQFRVFQLQLPDPNQFALPDPKLFNAEKERLVWAMVGIEVSRGQPLGCAITGNPYFNRLYDTENPNMYKTNVSEDPRLNMSFDCKQTQLLMVGSEPPLGEHWQKRLCEVEGVAKGDCPPLELAQTTIQDGDMADIGYGAMDFRVLQETKADAPMDVLDTISKYPDYIRMNKHPYGDYLWFWVRKEQMYVRHFFARGGNVGETITEDLHIPRGTNEMGSTMYSCTPSGSVVSSESQIFNKAYWLRKAQGLNNGVCWRNQMFVSLVDNTRGTNLHISQKVDAESDATFKITSFKQYARHVEEYNIEIILELCKVPLTTDVLSHLHTMDPDILEDWSLGVNPPPAQVLENQYRNPETAAVRCPREAAPVPPTKVDRYDKLNFWKVNLRDSLSSELSQYPLGRKFLTQYGVRRAVLKRPLSNPGKRLTKRKRTK